MVASEFPQLNVCDHPVAQHNVAILRHCKTSHEAFRLAAKRVTQFLLYAATRHLPLTSHAVTTPVADTQVNCLDANVPILITPILRAGLMMADVALEVLPTAGVYHVGLYRNEETLEPVTYYNKLPSHIAYQNARILVLDPMLATGGSAVAAISMFAQRGVNPQNIHFICLIAAPEGVQHVVQQYPEVRIFAGALDERLNEKGYIVPGLGDAGDRMFATQ